MCPPEILPRHNTEYTLTNIVIYKYLLVLNIAFRACPDNVFCASENEPPAVKMIPRYLKFLTISSSFPL